MREVGFEPTKALSHRILSPAHLTTLLPSQDVNYKFSSNFLFKKASNSYLPFLKIITYL